MLTRMLLVGVLTVIMMGCGDDDSSYDRGYDDGYAVGYNTACEIRTTQIHGDWDNASYSEGFSKGVVDGITSCNDSRR